MVVTLNKVKILVNSRELRFFVVLCITQNDSNSEGVKSERGF